MLPFKGRYFAAKDTFCACRYIILHLPVQFIPQICTGHRPQIYRCIKRIAGLPLHHLFFKKSCKLLFDGRYHYESFCSYTALTIVDETAVYTGFSSLLQVSICQYDIGIAPAKLKHCLL